MEVVTWPLEQPAFDELGLVGGVVVEHQMDLEVRRNGLIDEVEKFPELQTAVFGKAATENLARGDIQSGKETGGACRK